ncbi:MAG: FtsX-like permease family protein [Bacteroidota bacterium]|nr:FtsX-like permease family protein [Bacteroidota bacterium]
MNLPLKIAGRYFFSRKKSGGFNAITFISYISLLGYAAGAAALLIVLSVFNGFEGLFTKMYSNFDADIQLIPKTGKTFFIQQLPIEKIKAIPEVKGCAFVWEESAILRYNNKQTLATIKAVDEHYLALNPLDSNLLKGQLVLKNGDTNFAVVGQGIGYQLGIDPDDQFHYMGVYLPRKGKVDMLNPESALAHGVVFPIGIFGIQDEVDNKYVLLPLGYIQTLLEDSNKVSSMELRLHDPSRMDEVKSALQALVGDYYILKNRYEQRETFFKVMQSEKTISYFILVFILIIAGFNTIGSLYMLVIEKRNDLQLFSSIGMTATMAARVFIYQSLLIALSGGLVGIILGIIVIEAQQKYGLVALQSNGSIMVNAYPVLLKWSDTLMVLATLVFLGLITSFYPAYKAAKAVDASANA